MILRDLPSDSLFIMCYTSIGICPLMGGNSVADPGFLKKEGEGVRFRLEKSLIWAKKGGIRAPTPPHPL